jgi:hypothetical protein
MTDGVDADGPIAQLRVRMAKALKGFEGGLPEGCDPWSLRSGRPDAKLFPVPELVLFALREVMGFRWSGVGEKVRWSVYATVDREPFVFELRKFGFAIGSRDGVPHALVKRVESQLSSSLRLLEPLLSVFAKGQIAEGNLTLVNRMGELTNRYQYFRKLADDAFAPDPEPVAETGATDGSFDVAAFAAYLNVRMNRSVEREQDGYFASGAMVDAYYSRLEHRVLLLRALSGGPSPPATSGRSSRSPGTSGFATSSISRAIQCAESCSGDFEGPRRPSATHWRTGALRTTAAPSTSTCRASEPFRQTCRDIADGSA